MPIPAPADLVVLLASLREARDQSLASANFAAGQVALLEQWLAPAPPPVSEEPPS